MATVLIVDSVPGAGPGLTTALRQAAERCDVIRVGSAEAALAQLAERRVDCVVFERWQYTAGRLEDLQAIRCSHLGLPVVVDTEPDDASRIGALALGVQCYVAGAGDTPTRLGEVVREVLAQCELERANGRISGGIFVGRRRELAELTAAIDEGMAGRGRLVLLSGEAGIGKTSLANQAADFGRKRGMRTIYGRCHETGGAPPYWPWIQVLRAFAPGRAGDGGAWEEHGGAQVPVDFASVPPLESDAELFPLFDAATVFLSEVAHQQPLMILLGDLHWADDKSVRLLRFVARELRDAPLLIIGNYRDGELGPRHPLAAALPELCREQLHEMPLRGLSEEEVGELVAMVAGGNFPRFAHAVHRRTEGNPLFIQEILRDLADARVVYHDGTGWTSDLDPDDMPIPVRVRDVISRRVARLSAPAQEILAAAAVIGREFRLAQLADLLDRPAAALGDGLGEAVGARLLTELPGRHRGYVFSHALIGETMSNSLTRDTRSRLDARMIELSLAARSGVVRADAGAAEGPLFRHDGELWTIVYGGTVVRLRDLTGLRYLAHLLRHPGEDVFVLDLLAAVDGIAPLAVARVPDSLHIEDQYGEPVMDAAGRRALASRCRELEAEIDELDANNDWGRVANLRQELERIQEYAAKNVGLAGRTRRAPCPVERARQIIQKGVKKAKDRIRLRHPMLAEHFDLYVKTGRFCIYRPQPRVGWEF